MRRPILIVASIFSLACATAQTKPDPINLDVLVKGLANPDFVEVPELTEQVQRRGIDFDPGKQLSAILGAASTGRRDHDQVAALVMACFSACHECRMRLLAPMTTGELRTLLKSGYPAEAILQEIRIRGVSGLEVSELAANMWRAEGANEQVVSVLVPDDKIPASPIVGYKALPLQHAEEYDLSAPQGWLRVATQLPANSQSEFMFKHNGLFVRAVKGEGPTDSEAYFNKPTPRNTPAELVDFTSTPDSSGNGGAAERRGIIPGLLKGKGKVVAAPLIETSYVAATPDGRTAFRILLTNKEAEPQQFSFYLRWRVLTTPKPSAPAQKR